MVCIEDWERNLLLRSGAMPPFQVVMAMQRGAERKLGKKNAETSL